MILRWLMVGRADGGAVNVEKNKDINEYEWILNVFMGENQFEGNSDGMTANYSSFSSRE